MEKHIKVLVLRTAGTNCNGEMANAFEHFGAQVDQVHIKRLRQHEILLKDYHILAIPGGFTYGDDIESGRILANELRLHLGKDLAQFIQDKKLIIGICNGFQILVKAGILPGNLDKGQSSMEEGFKQSSTLTNNDSGKFEDRWTYLKVAGESVWTKNLSPVVYFPVAHAEGKFIPMSEDVLQGLKHNQQIAFTYCSAQGGEPVYPENPNGSTLHIAGITDVTGRILGLMPHPERHFYFENSPNWNGQAKKNKLGDGAQIFKNGVEYVRNTLLSNRVTE
ncbi:MAG: phosphoribosylformylglycinamidine synthase I [Candidatus Omnitrophica bacterium]|nr:phosphoribosylformylglycinamidine synthase I [Candidatus Omnitrophota bacterium]